MQPTILLILCTALILPLNLRAETITRYLDVTCDPARQKVRAHLKIMRGQPPDEKWYGTLRPTGNQRQAYKLTSQIDYAECLLARGKLVRIKVREAPMRGGRCGGDPEMTLDLWVGQRKWLDRHWIDGNCQDRSVSRVTLTPRALVLCESSRFEEDASGASRARRCKTLPARRLPRGIDRKEYPLNPTPTPIHGSIVFERGLDTPLCRQMVEPMTAPDGRKGWRWQGFPDGYVDLITQNEGEDGTGTATATARYRFDLDNDGVTDRVIGIHTDAAFGQSDNYTLLEPEAGAQSWPDFWDDLSGRSTFNFPLSVALCDGAPCAPDELEAKGRLQFQGDTGQGTGQAFHVNWTRAWPFGWKGKTHFLMSTGYPAVYAVVIPSRGAAPVPVCLLREFLR